MVSAVIGTMAAIGLSQLPRRTAATIPGLISLPMMLPPLVLAVALVTFYVSLGIRLSLLTVTTSHVLLTQPFVIHETAATQWDDQEPALPGTATSPA